MTSRVVLVLLLALGSVGCAGSQTAKQAKAPRISDEPSFEYLFPKPGERNNLGCPAALPGVRVASIPTDAGVLIVFTTNEGVLEVRRRAKKMADDLDQDRDIVSPEAPKGAEHSEYPNRFSGIRTTTRFEEIPEGATVEVLAVDPEDSLALRDQLDRIVRDMQRERDCPEELLAGV